MGPYLLLILIPFIGNFIAIDRGRVKIQMNLGNDNCMKNLTLPSFFVTLFFLVIFRDVSIGNDTINYKYFFETFKTKEITSLVSTKNEILFSFFTWLIGKMTDNFQLYLTIFAAVTLLAIALLYMEDRRHSYLKIVLYLNMSTFVVLFSGVRQSLSCAIGLIAYRFVRKGNVLAFLVCVAIAMGFHQSAFILLVMYPVYHIELNKKHLFFIVPILTVLFVFNGQVFSFLLKVLALIYPKFEDVAMETTNAFTMLIVFVFFAILAYLITDEKKMNKEDRGLRNFLLLAIIIQCFVPLHALAMRMNYYYILFIPILMSKVMDVAQIKFKQVVNLVEVIMCMGFTAYFVYTLISSLETGGALNTVPYVPFWR